MGEEDEQMQHVTHYGWGHGVRGWWRCSCGAGETDHLSRDFADLAARLHVNRHHQAPSGEGGQD